MMIMSSVSIMHAVFPGFCLQNLPLSQLPTALQELFQHHSTVSFVVGNEHGGKYGVVMELNMEQQVDLLQMCIHIWKTYIGLNGPGEEISERNYPDICRWCLCRLPPERAIEMISGHLKEERSIEDKEEEEEVRQILLG